MFKTSLLKSALPVSRKDHAPTMYEFLFCLLTSWVNTRTRFATDDAFTVGKSR